MSRRNVSWFVGANIRDFDSKMQTVERRFQQVGRQATFLGRDLRTSITVPVLAAGGAILALAHKTAEYADRVSDLSDVTGISTDALQEWDFVANRVGVSTDVIASAFSSLGRRMTQFQRGSGPAVDAARDLGVEFRNADGSMRNADDLIMDLLGSLNQMPADLDRAGIGTALFGRRWEMLAPIIGRGSDNIERIRQEAHELGIVLDGEAIESANRFREEMVNFQEQMSATGRNLAIEFMPTILEFLPIAERMVHSVGSAVQSFADLDQQQQINRIRMAGYAAAIGPVLILTGSMITSITKLVGVVRALTTAMATNPFLAIATVLAVIAERVYTINTRLRRMRDEVQEVMNMSVTGTSDELERINAAIAAEEKIMENVIKQHETMGVVGSEASEKQLQGHRDNIEALIQLRDEAAKLQMDDIISQRSVDNSDKVKENIAEAARSAGILRFQIDPPDGNIFDPTDEIFEIGASMFNAQQMETWQFMIGSAEDYSHRLVNVNEEQKEMTRSMDGFGHLGVQIFDRLIFQGERFSQTLRSIGRQLAMRGIMTLLTGGFGGGVSAGIGKILGVNDAIISPRGDVITTHPDDYLIATKDPGKMASNISGAGKSGGRMIANISINMDGRQIYHGLQDVEYKMR